MEMSETPQTRPIRKGDRVKIKLEWRDPGDETLLWIACEDEDGGRVLIMPVGTGLSFPPRQVVRTDMLHPVFDVPEFVVFSASEARASDDTAGFWSNQDGWTTLDGATKFDEAGGLLPLSAGNDAVWMRAPYGLSYTVLQVELEPGAEPILFDCWAESIEHACEQAENAYPGCRVVGTTDEAAMRPFKLVVEAYALNEYGDGPGYAVITITKEFITRLEEMESLCRIYDLESVAVSMSPDEWGDLDELNLRGNSLNVWCDGRFWFTAQPKHSDYTCETRGIDIAMLRHVIEAGPDAAPADEYFRWVDGTLYYAADPAAIVGLVDMSSDRDT
jgi:hypothetical protein